MTLDHIQFLTDYGYLPKPPADAAFTLRLDAVEAELKALLEQ